MYNRVCPEKGAPRIFQGSVSVVMTFKLNYIFFVLYGMSSVKSYKMHLDDRLCMEKETLINIQKSNYDWICSVCFDHEFNITHCKKDYKPIRICIRFNWQT